MAENEIESSFHYSFEELTNKVKEMTDNDDEDEDKSDLSDD